MFGPELGFGFGAFVFLLQIVFWVWLLAPSKDVVHLPEIKPVASSSPKEEPKEAKVLSDMQPQEPSVNGHTDASASSREVKDYTIRELKLIASNKHVKGYSSLTKGDLYRLLIKEGVAL